jgi:molybdate transport system permease protein
VKRPFELVLALAAGLAVAFLALPLVALFVRVSPATLISALGDPAVREAVFVSIRTTLIAHAIVLIVGTPAAYLLATRRFRGRGAILTAFELPLVLPPAVAGLALLAAFGRQGLLGGSLNTLGLSIPFTQIAVVMAIIFVSSPFYLRWGVSAFEAVDPHLLDASRTLGAGPAKTFRRVALPLAAGGLGTASSLAWARGLGEFGATIMFAGSFPGETRTLPLAVYAEFDRDFDVALAIGALLVVASLAILATIRLLLSWTRSPSTSPYRSARSTSA